MKLHIHSIYQILLCAWHCTLHTLSNELLKQPSEMETIISILEMRTKSHVQDHPASSWGIVLTEFQGRPPGHSLLPHSFLVGS